MYLGRQQLGSWLDIYLQCANSSGVEAMPTDVPNCRIRRASDGATVYNHGVPLVDRSVSVGLFCARVFLGYGFAVGLHYAELTYAISGVPFVKKRVFEVCSGGDVNGASLGMHYYHRPHADFVVWQTDGGAVMRGRNPRV